MDDFALAFDAAGGEEDGGEPAGAAEAFEGFGPDDEIGDAGLVFEGDEDDAAGGAGALADEDDAGDGDPASCWAAFGVAEFLGAEGAALVETVADEGDGVGAEGEAAGGVVVEDVALLGEGRESGR